MFEFKTITVDSEVEIDYYWHDLLNPGKWNYRFEDHFNLAIF